MAEDLDSLVAENRFLKAKLNTAEEESESIKMTLAKYKQMAEAVNVQVTFWNHYRLCENFISRRW